MKNTIKKFFGINDKNFKLEWMDISTVLTVINITLIVCGIEWAPIIGIINAVANIIVLIIKKGHINGYIMQTALLIMNIYFLKG